MRVVSIFLDNFAEKFGKTEEEKKAIRSSTGFYIDYLDGVFRLYRLDLNFNRIYTYDGGNNGYIFDSSDYKVFWSGIRSLNEDFNEWLDLHSFTDKDMMAVGGDFFKEGVNIECDFGFYIERFK